MDFKPWTEVFVKELGKAARKHFNKLALELVCVDIGLKPSFLFDLFITTPERLCTTLEGVHAKGLTEKRLSVLVVGDDIFILHLPTLQSLIPNMRHTPLIDVSETIAAPVLLSDPAVTGVIEETITALLALGTAAHDGGGPMRLELHPEVNLTTVFGLLLGYPVVYWSMDGEGGNCLGMVPLHVVSVVCEVSLPNGRRLSHQPISFSLPEALVPEVEERVHEWKQRVQDVKTEHVTFTVSDCVSVLPSVAM